MNKIIKGIRYDTETADRLASYQSPDGLSSFSYYEEILCRTKAGLYFLYGNGNAASKYSRQCGTNEWCGDEKIIPMTEADAKQWAEKYLDGDEYETIFGPVEQNNLQMPDFVRKKIMETITGDQYEQVCQKQFPPNGKPFDLWSLDKVVECDGVLLRVVLIEKCVYDPDRPEEIDHTEDVFASAYKVKEC